MSRSHNRSEDFRKFFRDRISVIAITLLAAASLRLFVIGAYRVPNATMIPGLRAGDFVFGFRVPYGLRIPILGTKIPTHHIPKRGEVVVFQLKDKSLEMFTLLKRVIGIPGDHIEVQQGRVRLNGNWLTYAPPASEDGLILVSDHVKMREQLEGRWHSVVLPKDDMEKHREFVVPADSVYVLSDDRSLSDDSRQFGAILSSEIEADAFIIWLSLNWQETGLPSIRWDRTLKLVE